MWGKVLRYVSAEHGRISWLNAVRHCAASGIRYSWRKGDSDATMDSVLFYRACSTFKERTFKIIQIV